MQFYSPEWLFALWLLVPVIFFMGWITTRKRTFLARFGHLPTIERLIESHSKEKVAIKKLLILTAYTMAVLALAQPQWGEEKKEIRRKGIEIVFVVDTSLSMLAEDIKPNRLEKAKLEMKSFLKILKGDKVGIVTFAGSGFVQSPLTIDYDAFILFANSIEAGFIPDAGTSLSAAIGTTIKAFSGEKSKHHVAVLMSDGEHHEGDVQSAIQAAKEANLRIYTLGLGKPDGGPIPLRSKEGNVSGYKKDRGGEVVITKLGEELLKQIAEETGGKYFQVTAGEKEVEYIYQDMQNIEKQDFQQKMITEREDHYQLFLGFALLFLLIETFISETKRVREDIVETVHV